MDILRIRFVANERRSPLSVNTTLRKCTSAICSTLIGHKPDLIRLISTGGIYDFFFWDLFTYNLKRRPLHLSNFISFGTNYSLSAPLATWGPSEEGVGRREPQSRWSPQLAIIDDVNIINIIYLLFIMMLILLPNLMVFDLLKRIRRKLQPNYSQRVCNSCFQVGKELLFVSQQSLNTPLTI